MLNLKANWRRRCSNNLLLDLASIFLVSFVCNHKITVPLWWVFLYYIKILHNNSCWCLFGPKHYFCKHAFCLYFAENCQQMLHTPLTFVHKPEHSQHGNDTQLSAWTHRHHQDRRLFHGLMLTVTVSTEDQHTKNGHTDFHYNISADETMKTTCWSKFRSKQLSNHTWRLRKRTDISNIFNT